MGPFDERCISCEVSLHFLVDETRWSPVYCFGFDDTVVLPIMVTDTFILLILIPVISDTILFVLTGGTLMPK